MNYEFFPVKLGMKLEELVRRLKKASEDLKRIFGDSFVGLILFGSYSRGEATEKSDVDVLVVVRGLRGLNIRSEIYSILAKHVGKPLTLVDADISDLLKKDLEITPLLLNILYDGIVIYDESGMLENLKSMAIELVKKAGLIRYRTPDGKYGWKRYDNKPLEIVEI